MTVVEPRLLVDVDFTASHLDDPTGLSFTDLSERVRGWTWQAGRADQTGKFGVGSCTITLDNTDRQLDPLNPAGLTAQGGSSGQPLCPARVRFSWDGGTYDVIGRGAVAPEAWRPRRAKHGAEATVTLTVVDVTGVWPWIDMATTPWLALVEALEPAWWLPGEVVAPSVTGDGFEVPNRAGGGGSAVTRSAGARTVTDAVITGLDSSLTSATAEFRFDDVGRPAVGDGIPVPAVIDEVISATEVNLNVITTEAATGVEVTFGATIEEPIKIDNPLTTLDTAGNSVEALGTTRARAIATTASIGMKPYVALVSAEEDVFPDGDLAAHTISLMWMAPRYDNGSLTGVGQAEIFTVTTPGGLRRLRCWIDADNASALKLTVYDDLGDELTTLTAPDPVSESPTGWGDGIPHGIVVRTVGGTSVDLFVDGFRVTELVDVPDDAYAGDLTLGEVPNAAFPKALFDELMVFHRALSDSDCARLATAPNLDGTWGRGETPAERLAYFYDAAQWIPLADEDDEVHPPPAALVDPDPTVTLVGVEEAGSWPATLGAAVAAVADGIAGDVYALRSGIPRVRSLLALDDEDLADVYATPTAHFTDEPEPGSDPVPLRRGPLSFTGLRLDRVVTSVKVEYPSVPAGEISQVPISAVLVETRASRFGRREQSWKLATEHEAIPPALTTAVLDRYEDPPVELDTVPLFPREDTTGAVMEWLVTALELEAPVMATDTPPTGDPIEFELLHVQGWTWSWAEGLTTSCTLNLAKS